MKIEKRLFLLFIILVLTLFVSNFVTADNCGGSIQCHCGDWLIESQTMWYDLIDCPDEGLSIWVDNITLDCDGHLIDGVGTYYSGGISLDAPENTVINCNIQQFYWGIIITKGSSNNIISYNTITNNGWFGVYLSEDSNNNVLSDNIVSYNAVVGIYLTDSHNNFLYSNTVNNNGGGIVVGGYNNELYGNTVNNNGDVGLSVYGSNNEIWNNTFAGNYFANAYESEYSTNSWNLSNIGNYWDDFPSNPGYPYQYEIFGPGNGIDWHPVGELPWVWVNLTSTGITTFPPTGGQLNYNILVGNNENTPVTLDIWIDATMPNGTIYLIHRPLLNFEMRAGFSTSRDRTTNIPARAPAGEYSLNSYLGIYSITTPIIYAEDHFNFTKEEV